MKSLVIFLLLIFAHQVVVQQENGEFYAISEKIENLLRYKHKSTTQLKTLLVELKEYSAGNESSYDQIKRRVENVLFPIEIKLVPRMHCKFGGVLLQVVALALAQVLKV